MNHSSTSTSRLVFSLTPCNKSIHTAAVLNPQDKNDLELLSSYAELKSYTNSDGPLFMTSIQSSNRIHIGTALDDIETCLSTTDIGDIPWVVCIEPDNQ